MSVCIREEARDADGCARLALLLLSMHQPAGHGVRVQALHLHEEVPFYLNRKRMGTPVEFTRELPLHTRWVRTDQKAHSSSIVVGIVGTKYLRRGVAYQAAW